MNVTDNKSCIQKAQKKPFKKFKYIRKNIFVCNVLYTFRLSDWKCYNITNITIIM